MTEPNPLEHISTDDLIAELRRRSSAIFLAMRPLAEHREFTATYDMGVDGHKVETAEDRDRSLGLAYQAMMQCVPRAVYA